MKPASPLFIKQNLNNACLLVKPKQAAMETFKSNLIKLLTQQNEVESQEKVNIYLKTIFRNTFFDADHQEPEYSSPVCFATESGLREGFEEPSVYKIITLSLENHALKPKPVANQMNLNPALKEAINLIKLSVKEILKYPPNKPLSDTTAQEKQVSTLVYQLYELTPDENALAEESLAE